MAEVGVNPTDIWITEVFRIKIDTSMSSRKNLREHGQRKAGGISIKG